MGQVHETYRKWPEILVHWGFHYIFHIKLEWSHFLSDFHENFTIKQRISNSFIVYLGMILWFVCYKNIWCKHGVELMTLFSLFKQVKLWCQIWSLYNSQVIQKYKNENCLNIKWEYTRVEVRRLWFSRSKSLKLKIDALLCNINNVNYFPGENLEMFTNVYIKKKRRHGLLKSSSVGKRKRN